MDAGGTSYIPWSHGLFMAAVWSLLGFALAFLLSRHLRTGLIIGALVFSHWVLDFISHPMGMGKKLPPDLPSSSSCWPYRPPSRVWNSSPPLP